MSPHRAATIRRYHRHLAQAQVTGQAHACDRCGRPFRAARSPIDPQGRRFCSTTCATWSPHAG